ncbi:unnamed protein product, partial [Phaeothamnion confervicola]
ENPRDGPAVLFKKRRYLHGRREVKTLRCGLAGRHSPNFRIREKLGALAGRRIHPKSAGRHGAGTQRRTAARQGERERSRFRFELCLSLDSGSLADGLRMRGEPVARDEHRETGYRQRHGT